MGRDTVSEPSYLELLEQAVSQIDAPEEYGAVLEGSLAEGFGNSSSDVDFLLIAPTEDEFLTMPTLVFVGGRRVEIRVISLRNIRENAERVRRGARSPKLIEELPWDLLDRCQRLTKGTVLRGSHIVELARSAFDFDLSVVIAERFAQSARSAARHATAMLGLGQSSDAERWARSAAAMATKAWLARRGEAYVSSKWIAQQFERLGQSSDVREQVARLLFEETSRGDPRERALLCLELAAFLGVSGCSFDPGQVRLVRRREMTTWPIGNRLCVVRRKADVFVLGSRAATIWRLLRFDVPLPEALASLGAEPETGAILAKLQRFGLVGLAWGRSPISAAPESTPAPGPVTPLAGVGRAPAGDPEAMAVDLVPISGARFAAAGMAVAWANVMTENAREDARGALEKQQWSTLVSALRKMLRKTCFACASSRGVTHGPSTLPLDEEAWLSPLDAGSELGPSVVALERRLEIVDRDSAERAIAATEQLVERLRRECFGGEVFPASFDSATEWQRTIDVGYDWVRLGAFMDADFPIEEARDLLGSVSAGPSPASRRRQPTPVDP